MYDFSLQIELYPGMLLVLSIAMLDMLSFAMLPYHTVSEFW